MPRNLFILIFASAAFLLVAWTYLNIDVERNGSSEPSGVILSAPPGYWVTEISIANSANMEDLAKEATRVVLENPQRKKIALKYVSDVGADFLLLNLPGEEIQQMTTNKYGTAIQKTWSGHLKKRLQHAIKTGMLTPAGMPEPISRNLYH